MPQAMYSLGAMVRPRRPALLCGHQLTLIDGGWTDMSHGPDGRSHR